MRNNASAGKSFGKIPSLNWQEKYNHNKMALLKVDLHFNEAFIKPIRGLYKEYIVTVDGFKENNAELLKGRWIDTRHGSDGDKIYKLYRRKFKW